MSQDASWKNWKIKHSSIIKNFIWQKNVTEHVMHVLIFTPPREFCSSILEGELRAFETFFSQLNRVDWGLGKKGVLWKNLESSLLSLWVSDALAEDVTEVDATAEDATANGHYGEAFKIKWMLLWPTRYSPYHKCLVR